MDAGRFAFMAKKKPIKKKKATAKLSWGKVLCCEPKPKSKDEQAAAALRDMAAAMNNLAAAIDGKQDSYTWTVNYS